MIRGSLSIAVNRFDTVKPTLLRSTIQHASARTIAGRNSILDLDIEELLWRRFRVERLRPNTRERNEYQLIVLLPLKPDILAEPFGVLDIFFCKPQEFWKHAEFDHLRFFSVLATSSTITVTLYFLVLGNLLSCFTSCSGVPS